METKSPPPCPSTVTVRRNPYRKARDTPLTNPSLIPSKSTSSSKLTQISSFPIQDILSEEIRQNPPPIVTAASTSPSLDSIAENLKVYLRIRPLVPLKGSTKNTGDPNPKSRPKNVWPHKSKKNSVKEKKNTNKKSYESCIKVSDDFQSVTLLPPSHLQETKRIKSEVYEGFSHVFSAESTQTEVYEKMVNPLVEDFLKGKSRMLAALGPTGSGKTHTVFGSPREPGMVPLALQRIFKPAQGQFYMSIFEICAERGKAERICDLTLDGPDLSMQHSVIKGLQEVLAHDVAEAELLIARALMKRSTAMTNANSQSSRSQCVINIRRGRGTDRYDAENDEQSNSAVLSIVDLAGAEREKRTGNQGARLAESNFINNTSMVFGLCLRSLLEHQKNPKKALHKHFQNSLLTKYLRDYLEGKKRMTLILTVKCGEEDYLDASYLLRQASPYMKIKFTNIEAQSNFLSNKRQFQTTRVEQPKRMKLDNLDTSAIEEKIVGDENQPPDEEDLRSCNVEFKNTGTPNWNSGHLMKERTHQIMQNFAKALWSVLKQHNEKLKAAESEILILRENLRNEKKRSTEMAKELQNLRSCCTCSQGNSVASAIVNVGESFESTVLLKGDTCCGADETKLDLNSSNDFKSESSGSPRICDSTPGEDQALSLTKQDLNSSNDFKSDSSCGPRICDSTPEEDQVLSLAKQDLNSSNDLKSESSPSPRIFDSTPEEDQVLSLNLNSSNDFKSESNSSPRICDSTPEEDQVLSLGNVKVHFPSCNCSSEKGNSLPRQQLDLCSQVPSSNISSNLSRRECFDDNQEPEAMVSISKADVSSPSICDSNGNCQNCQMHDESFPGNIHEASSDSNCAAPAAEQIDPNSDVAVCNSSDGSSASVLPVQQLGENNEAMDTVDPLVLPKDVEHTQRKDLIVVPETESELRPDISCNSLRKEKPKRRLLPASSMLVREISTLGADEIDKPRGNGGGKNMAASERRRTQGSVTLIRLLGK